MTAWGQFLLAFGLPFVVYQFLDAMFFRMWCKEQGGIVMPLKPGHPFFDSHPSVLFLIYRLPCNLRRALIAANLGQILVLLIRLEAR